MKERIRPDGFIRDYDAAWANYRAAMDKRRPGSALDREAFESYVEGGAAVVAYGETYVIGQMDRGIFTPTHFSPAGLKAGIDAVKALREYRNVAFAVTPDLYAMLVRLGYHGVPGRLTRVFRGAAVEKKLAVSSWWVIGIYAGHAVSEKARKIWRPVSRLVADLDWLRRRAFAPSTLVDEDALYD